MTNLARRSILAAAASLALPTRALAQTHTPAQPAGTPIRIGCITALSGAQEVLGRPILSGAQIAVDQLNATGGVMGRPLQLVWGDAHADPARAVELAHELTGTGINLLCGCVTSDLALAVSATMPKLGAVLITCAAQSERLTHDAFNSHYFRVTDQTIMRNRAQARLMAERYPDVTRWGAIVPDSEYGRSAWAAFRDGLMERYPALGNRDLGLFEPVVASFGETDFRTHVDALKQNGADGLFVAVYGDDGISFYQQARKSGLLHGTKVVADAINEFLVPLELGAATPEHLWLAMTWYFGGYQHLPIAKELYETNLLRTGNSLPMGSLSSGHAAVYAYAHAIRAAESTETTHVIKALEGLSFDTAKGRVTFRPEDHQAICDVNFVRMKSSIAEPTLDAVDYVRADVEVAEFVRYDGASVIETPAPGHAAPHRTVMATIAAIK